MKKILILGTGCSKCRKLAEMTEYAARELNLEFQLEKVGDMNRILAFDVLTTPALVVDGEVKVSGRVPTVNEIKTMIG